MAAPFKSFAHASAEDTPKSILDSTVMFVGRLLPGVRACVAIADDDGNEWFFHCTAIADGTRTIEVGTAVVFDVAPGRLGRWEAANIGSLAQD